LKLPRTILPWLVFAGGLTGRSGLCQHWMSAVDYPLNIGGRPLASWPAFVILVEMTILFVDHGGGRDDCPERAAHAVSPAVQRAQLQPLSGPLLPVIETKDPCSTRQGDSFSRAAPS
jgi:hypothetical protein